MTRGEVFARRASALVGTPFRPQGRSEGGLDCIGVVAATFEIDVTDVRDDYRLNDGRRADLLDGLQRWFRRVDPAEAAPGDVLLFQPGGRQLHLGVKTVGGFVHAHAGLRRVVETPPNVEFEVTDVFRRREG